MEDVEAPKLVVDTDVVIDYLKNVNPARSFSKKPILNIAFR